MAFGVWGFEYHIAAPDGVPSFSRLFPFLAATSAKQTTTEINTKNKEPASEGNCFSSKNRKEKGKKKKRVSHVFSIIIATCLYFFTIFYFFENISVIDNGPEKNEYVNSNFVHYHTSVLLLRISLQCPVSLEHDLPSRLNLPWLVAVWGFEPATLEVSEWSLKPPCVVAVPGRCFFFYDCSCYSTFNLMFSIQRRVWMYVLCCLHRLSGIYLFALSFYSI